jgi:hypothetical protein
MQVSVENLSKLERKLTVSVPSERLDASVRARLRELGQNVRLKGFRPGKVPAKVIEQRYGRQVRSARASTKRYSRRSCAPRCRRRSRTSRSRKAARSSSPRRSK